MRGSGQAWVLTVAAFAFGSSAPRVLAQRVPALSESAVLEGAPGAAEAWPIPPGVQVFFHQFISLDSSTQMPANPTTGIVRK